MNLTDKDIYNHAAEFTGIFVTQPARITDIIWPGVQAVYVPLDNLIRPVFAWCPNAFGNWFYQWEFVQTNYNARFISPLLYILSAN